jgi:hypothetical protein
MRPLFSFTEYTSCGYNSKGDGEARGYLGLDFRVDWSLVDGISVLFPQGE